MPPDERSNDLVHWQTTLVTLKADRAARGLFAGKFAFVSPGVVLIAEKKLEFKKGFLVRDPDGHVMQLVEK